MHLYIRGDHFSSERPWFGLQLYSQISLRALWLVRIVNGASRYACDPIFQRTGNSQRDCSINRQQFRFVTQSLKAMPFATQADFTVSLQDHVVPSTLLRPVAGPLTGLPADVRLTTLTYNERSNSILPSTYRRSSIPLSLMPDGSLYLYSLQLTMLPFTVAQCHVLVGQSLRYLKEGLRVEMVWVGPWL